MAPPYNAPVPQLLFVTGKGGVGKTTIAAALAQALAAQRRRVLVVETGADASLARLLGQTVFETEPAALAGGLHGVRIESRALVESYFRRLLRLPFLSRRLFASATFHAVTAAAPGVSEFVLLDHLAQWTEPGRFAVRAPYDMVIVDGPASGHALRLLRTPRQLAALVPRGPLAGAVGRVRALLDDARRTAVLLVSIPDEMAVTEMLETRAALADGVGIRLLRPVLNRVWPRRFSAADAAALAALRAPADQPLVAAAQLDISARHEAERHLARLRRAFGAAPVALHEVCAATLGPQDLARMGAALRLGLFEDA